MQKETRTESTNRQVYGLYATYGATKKRMENPEGRQIANRDYKQAEHKPL